MGAIAVFNYTTWTTRYPEFSGVTSDQATAYFNEATLYQVNDGSGPVGDPNIQLMLLNMLTAHIAQLYSGSTIQSVSNLVGRIGNATQGSISINAEMGGPEPGSKDWFIQSKYGSSWWQAVAVYRTAQYRRGRARVMNPWPGRLW